MKKISYLLCALFLTLFFCACEAKEIPQETVQPAGKQTAEEAIDSNALLYSLDLTKEIMSDPELAKETYEGNYYLINFIVDTVSNKDYIRGMSEHPLYTVKRAVYYAAYLPEEEREGVAIGDVIQVVGKISSIEKRFNGAIFVEITDAHCLRRTFQISGEVVMIMTNYDGEKLCNLLNDGILSPAHSEVSIYLPDDCDPAVGDQITVTGKLDGAFLGKVFFASADYSDYILLMEHPESIELVK